MKREGMCETMNANRPMAARSNSTGGRRVPQDPSPSGSTIDRLKRAANTNEAENDLLKEQVKILKLNADRNNNVQKEIGEQVTSLEAATTRAIDDMSMQQREWQLQFEERMTRFESVMGSLMEITQQNSRNGKNDNIEGNETATHLSKAKVDRSDTKKSNEQFHTGDKIKIWTRHMESKKINQTGDQRFPMVRNIFHRMQRMFPLPDYLEK